MALQRVLTEAGGERTPTDGSRGRQGDGIQGQCFVASSGDRRCCVSLSRPGSSRGSHPPVPSRLHGGPELRPHPEEPIEHPVTCQEKTAGLGALLHTVAQASCQLVTHPRLRCRLQGTHVGIWERERERGGFRPPSPGDSEEGRLFPAVSLRLAFLLPSAWSGGWDLPPAPQLLRPHDLLPAAPPEASHLPGARRFSRCGHFILNENVAAPWWPSAEWGTGGS